MCMEADRAVEFYQKACLAVEQGEADLAEVYYLQSMDRFEKAGGAHHLNAANALNALAFLRKAHGNYEGALRSAKQSLQIMEGHKIQSADADLIRNTSWELIELINSEFSSLG